MRRIVIAAVFLIACGSATPPPVAPPADVPTDAATGVPTDAAAPMADTGTLEITIAVMRTGNRGPIREGDVAITNEDIWIVLELDHPAYTYFGGLTSDGKPYLRFPAPDGEPLLPAGIRRLPTNPSRTYYLMPPAGHETIFVIASRQPLVDVDHTLAVLVGEIPVAPEPPRPATGSGSTRARPPTPPRKPPRRDPFFKPDPALIAGMNGRLIGERDGKLTVTDVAGLVVYVLRFSHSAAP